MQDELAFVILTWNSASFIERCISSIDKADFINSRVYIVDNGSEDNTCEVIEDLKKICTRIVIELIKLPYNYGTTVSRNLAIRRAIKTTKYICILDSDTQVNRDAIMHMIDKLKRDPKEAIIGPVLVGTDGIIQNSGRGIPTIFLKLLKAMPIDKLNKIGERMERIPKNSEFVTVGYLMSACWLMPASLVEKIGFLDERIFYAPEDVEFCLRAWKNGYSVLYDTQVTILHEWQRLSRKRLFSKHNFEHIKGLLYLFFKYHYCFRIPNYVKYKE